MDELELAKWKVELHMEIIRDDIQKCVAQLSAPWWKVWITRKKKHEALKFFRLAYERPPVFDHDDVGLLCIAGLAQVLLGPGAHYAVDALRYMRPGLPKTLVPALQSNDQRINTEAKQTFQLFRAATKSPNVDVRNVAALVIGAIQKSMNAESV
jgi:hypothetical protein